MGDVTGQCVFQSLDFFLRRTSKKRLMKDGIISWEAFRDDHPTLSFTFQSSTLKTEAALTEYQAAKKLPSGDLPGICKLSYENLAVELVPHLPPRWDDDKTDVEYGKLHCSTDRPNDVQCKIMSEMASRHGVVRDFVKA